MWRGVGGAMMFLSHLVFAWNVWRMTCGRITGVDESIRVQVRRPGTSAALGERCCVGAGGRDTAWSSTVAFHAPPGRTLTVVASTGGHIATVERFAITGVTTSP